MIMITLANDYFGQQYMVACRISIFYLLNFILIY